MEPAAGRPENRTVMEAIVGDIAGSRHEWRNCKSKHFPFLQNKDKSTHPCHFTDDTVMTVAVAVRQADTEDGAEERNQGRASQRERSGASKRSMA